MKSLARWGSLPLLGLPLGSWALGLGEIEPNSYLNQPLNAEIPFTATPEELSSLSVSLAPVAAFTGQGLDYPAFLNSIQFEISRNDAGQNVIIVTSNQNIAEPFVTMLVQVSHARGGFTREYSVLLDPPLFLPAEVQPEAISAPATRPPEPSVAGGVVERQPAPAPAPAVAPAPAPAVAPAPQPQAQPAPASISGDYTVQGGDTLWRIANQVRPAGVSVNQAMISIFDANQTAFDGNINRLRRGAILRIPPVADLGRVASTQANAEVQRQIDAWRNNVESTPSLVLLPPGDEQPAAGAADPAAAARVSALENQVTNLEANLANAAAERDEAQRLLELRNSEFADLQRQLNEAPAIEPVADTDPAADQAAEPLFADEAEPVAADEPVADEPVAAADEPEAADEPVSAPPPIVAQTPEPSLVDQALDFVKQPFVWAGAGAFALVLLALAFLRRRRGDVEDVTGQWEALEAELDEEADNAATARIRAQAEESDMVVVEGHDGDVTAEERKLSGTAEMAALDSGTAEIEAIDSGTAQVEALLDPDADDMLNVAGAFADAEPKSTPGSAAVPEAAAEPAAAPAEPTMSSQTLSSQTVINLDSADPIAEADFHMAYGLYDQAADLISKALSADPDNREYKLKLLEVYFVWGNKELFLESAKGLHGEIGGGGNPDWDKVVIMGKQICPDEPIFSEATAAAGEVDLDLESSAGSAGLDFAFDSEEDDGVDLDLGIVDDAELSIAASGVNAAVGGSAAASGSELSDDEMLDIGERTQAGLEAALLDVTDEEAEQTTPGGEIGDLDVTMESPTVSTESGDFADAITLESPTIEAEGPDAPTVETPTIEAPAPHAPDSGDTVEQARPAAASNATVDMTAELEIDDLGLDVGDLDGLSDDLAELSDGDIPAGGDATLEQTGVHEEDADLLSATGVTQVLDQQDTDLEHTGTAILGDEEATMMAPGLDSSATGTSTEVLEQPPSSFNPDPVQTEDDLDLNLDDFSSALDGADTVEQPGASGLGGLDLDVGSNPVADDEPTGTEEVNPLDPQTMTEVGTKLDLARAYIDMGDPEGAKSILEEVLSEGDTGQRSEAQALIDALPA